MPYWVLDRPARRHGYTRMICPTESAICILTEQETYAKDNDDVKLDTDFNPSSADTQYSDDFPKAWTETDDCGLNPTGELEIADNILNCADSANELRCFLVNYDKASSHSAINESNFTGKSVTPSSQSEVPSIF
ncbi:unnamed protein product [Dicrocoelium dendriticum]|nr:unnamed protein product [Dicrocoelium dendriticum]